MFAGSPAAKGDTIRFEPLSEAEAVDGDVSVGGTVRLIMNGVMKSRPSGTIQTSDPIRTETSTETECNCDDRSVGESTRR